MQTQQCGTKYAVFFFLGYFLMVPLIFLNLFIAIILEGFEQTSTKVNNLIQEDELEIDRFDNPDESSLSNVVNPPKCFLGHLKHY